MKRGESFAEGDYKKIYEDAERPEELVHAEFKKPLSAEQIKSTFYFNKIAHLLFPKNIPEIHIAGDDGFDPEADEIDPEKVTSYFKAERIETDENHNRIRDISTKAYSQTLPPAEYIEGHIIADKFRNSPEVKEFMQAMEDSGMGTDEGPQNYSFTKGGVVQYVDLNPAWFYKDGEILPKPIFDAVKMKEAIADLPEGEKEKGEAYLKRLNALWETELARAREGFGMTETETLQFLQGQGIKPLEKFEEGKPLLVVLEDMYRGDDGPFSRFPPSQRPSVARIDNPRALDFNLPLVDEETPGRTVYHLANTGGQVDMFAIDPHTGKTALVISESKNKNYSVRKENLFEANDELFPKGI